MVYEFEPVKFNHLPIILTFYTDLHSKYTLSYMAVYKPCQKCSETNIQHNFFVFSPILVKVTFSERKFDREFKYAIGFAVGGNVL